MTQAALGGEVEVPVIDGTSAKVKVTPGTQTGDQFRLRGKGFSVLRSAARGDMYIQVAVETPLHLTRRQRELLEEFEADAESRKTGSPESEGVLRENGRLLRGAQLGSNRGWSGFNKHRHLSAMMRLAAHPGRTPTQLRIAAHFVRRVEHFHDAIAAATKLRRRPIRLHERTSFNATAACVYT